MPAEFWERLSITRDDDSRARRAVGHTLVRGVASRVCPYAGWLEPSARSAVAGWRRAGAGGAAGVWCCGWGEVTGHPAVVSSRRSGACSGRGGCGQPPLAGGPAAGSDVSPGVDGLDEAAWRVFAPLVAARPVMRLSVDGGRSYPRARGLAAGRPAVPAAVATFDAAGRAPNVVFDLDVSKGGPARVAADAEGLAALLDGVGAAYVLDESPSGGLHVHVPLAEPAGFDEVARVMTAAKALFASLDRAPMSNRKTGCIRPPGAAHRLGGSQRLVTEFGAARRVFLRRNRPRVWARLVDRLAPADPAPPPAPDHADPPDRPRGVRRPLPAGLALLARTGGYAAGRYVSGSEARPRCPTGTRNAAAGSPSRSTSAARRSGPPPPPAAPDT